MTPGLTLESEVLRLVKVEAEAKRELVKFGMAHLPDHFDRDEFARLHNAFMDAQAAREAAAAWLLRDSDGAA